MFPRSCCGLLLACLALTCSAQIPRGYPGSYAETVAAAGKEGRLVIYASTDLVAANPLIKDFRALYPGIRVEYAVMNSTELYKRFKSESAAATATADVLWSIAMDLQLKLVNDGYAQSYSSPETANLPQWAVWRNEAFGTTFEPVVFVYNKRLLSPEEIPQTHGNLARLLRDNADRFKGKVTTYHIEKAGVGFLLATQDSKTSPAFWDLACALFATSPQFLSETSNMLERISSGESLIGYNLLGAYAIARARNDPSIGYVLPRDYTMVISRIMFVPRRASHLNAAKLWVDYILSQRGQQIIADQSQLFSIRGDVDGDATAAGLVRTLGSSIKPIVVGPGLLTYLDQAKSLEFIKRWEAGAQGCPRSPRF